MENKTWHFLRVVGYGEGVWILRHWGDQLILAYSLTRPAILVAGKGRGGMFLFFCFFTFIPVPLYSLSLTFISSTISSPQLSLLPFSRRRHKMAHKGWHVIKPQHNSFEPISCWSITHWHIPSLTAHLASLDSEDVTSEFNWLLGWLFALKIIFMTWN